MLPSEVFDWQPCILDVPCKVIEKWFVPSEYLNLKMQWKKVKRVLSRKVLAHRIRLACQLVVLRNHSATVSLRIKFVPEST